MALADRRAVAAGPRVRVRPFTRADVDAWQAWPDYADPLLVGTSPRRMSPEQRSRWFDDIVRRQRQLPFAIEDERGAFIGRLFLRHLRAEDRSSVLGIDLHPAVLGRGYGTEALRVFLRNYFEEMGFERMLLSVAAHNQRARRCYESVGFRTTGSHWDSHPGPDLSREPASAHLRGVLRRGVLGPEALFYDMRLDRSDWRGRAGDSTS